MYVDDLRRAGLYEGTVALTGVSGLYEGSGALSGVSTEGVSADHSGEVGGEVVTKGFVYDMSTCSSGPCRRRGGMMFLCARFGVSEFQVLM